MAAQLCAQTGPGGVFNTTSNVLWLSADVNVYSNAGTILATNTNNVQQWNDRSGNGRNAIQATAANRPNYYTGIWNGLPVIRFTASAPDALLSTGVTTGNEASVWAVASYATLPSSNPGIIQGAPAGSAFSSAIADKVIGMWVSSAGRLWGRGVQSNGTSRDVPVGASPAANTAYIYNNNYGGGSFTQYANNQTSATTTYDNTLRSWSDFGIGRQATEGWDGDIAEIIAFNQPLNAAQRMIVTNYLSAKYNIALAAGNDMYTMDNAGLNFDFDVAGIGRASSAGESHVEAQGPGIVRVLNASTLSNDEYFMWGHDNGTLQLSNTTDVPAPVTARFSRVWGVTEVGDVGSISVQFDLTGIADFAGVDACGVAIGLRLLIDSDNDGIFNEHAPITGAVNVAPDVYRFNNISAFNGNMRFTLGFYNPANDGPGGIGNVAGWWRADTGITANGSGLISGWADQSGNGRNLTSGGAARPSTATSAALNGQPVVRFGGDDSFTSSFSGPGGTNLTLALAANASAYQSMFRFGTAASSMVVYPYGTGAGTFVTSNDGGTGGGVNAGFVTSQNNIGIVRYRGNITTTGIQTYRNGSAVNNKTSSSSTLPNVAFTSGSYISGSNRFADGDAAELIYYNVALNDAQLYILNNYLSAKYNVTLSANDIYKGDDAGFDFDVAGIGQAGAGVNHTDSKGTGMVRIYNARNLDANEFLFWGHNNGTLSTVDNVDVPTGVDARLNRIWYASERNTAGNAAVQVGNVDIQFDLSALLQPITASDLVLLIDHDDDGIFNESGTRIISGAQALDCGNYLFTNVAGNDLQDDVRFTIGTTNYAQTPLPVTWLNFSGFVADGDATLQWATATELNNDFFTVERSSDGRQFAAVGKVDGRGTVVTRSDYAFIDEFMPYGRSYYRIRQTDFDGTHSYSNVITLESVTSGLSLIALPNPSTATQGFRLRVTGTEFVNPGEATVSVYDMNGRSVRVHTSLDSSGELIVHFDNSASQGIYAIKLTAPSLRGTLTTRVNLLR